MYVLCLAGGASIVSSDLAVSRLSPTVRRVNETRIAGHRVIKSFAVEPNAFTSAGEWPSGKFLGIQSIVEDRTGAIRVSTAGDFLQYDEGSNKWSGFRPCLREEEKPARGQLVVDQSGRTWVRGSGREPAYFDSRWHQTDSRPAFPLGDELVHIDPVQTPSSDPSSKTGCQTSHPVPR